MALFVYLADVALPMLRQKHPYLEDDTGEVEAMPPKNEVRLVMNAAEVRALRVAAAKRDMSFPNFIRGVLRSIAEKAGKSDGGDPTGKGSE